MCDVNLISPCEVHLSLEGGNFCRYVFSLPKRLSGGVLEFFEIWASDHGFCLTGWDTIWKGRWGERDHMGCREQPWAFVPSSIVCRWAKRARVLTPPSTEAWYEAQWGKVAFYVIQFIREGVGVCIPTWTKCFPLLDPASLVLWNKSQLSRIYKWWSLAAIMMWFSHWKLQEGQERWGECAWLKCFPREVLLNSLKCL